MEFVLLPQWRNNTTDAGMAMGMDVVLWGPPSTCLQMCGIHCNCLCETEGCDEHLLSSTGCCHRYLQHWDRASFIFHTETRSWLTFCSLLSAEMPRFYLVFVELFVSSSSWSTGSVRSVIHPLPSNRQHLSYDVCLEVRGEIVRNFSMQYNTEQS